MTDFDIIFERDWAKYNINAILERKDNGNRYKRTF